MYNFCKKNVLTNKGLILNVDISNEYIWDQNTDFSLSGVTKYDEGISDDITLVDYGLTMYDNGVASTMEDCYNLNSNDKTFKLNRIGEKNSTGGTLYNNYDINYNLDPNIGSYFDLNGGYLQGFFKLDGYNYEILPPRYNDGFTIETLLNISGTSEGIFFYMGVRSEDKYNPYFSGETYVEDDEYKGVLTSEKNNLSAYIDKTILNENFRDYEKEKYLIEKNKNDQIENLKNNVISFEITPNKTIKIKRIDLNGNLKQYESENTITTLGWNLLDVTFKPYTIINNYNKNKFNCYSNRKGELNVFVNGVLFWKLNDFDEFYFKPIKNHKEKQIGIPFNISWGGGSLGLKNSYHYDRNIYNIYNNDDLTYINNNFIVDGNATLNYYPVDESIGVDINNDNKLILRYNNQINLLSGHIYKMSAFINANIYNKLMDFGNIYFDVDGNFNNYNVLDEQRYTTKRINPEWYELILEFRVDKSCENYYFYPLIIIESNIGFINGSTFKVKDFKINNTDKLSKYTHKSNTFIENYFDSSFKGGIQKLRLYNRGLMVDEIKNNVKFEFNNEYYNVNIIDGGRLIKK